MESSILLWAKFEWPIDIQVEMSGSKGLYEFVLRIEVSCDGIYLKIVSAQMLFGPWALGREYS